MSINLYDMQRMLQNNGVLISFSGRFSQEVIEELGEAVKKYLETDALSKTDTYNVFSVFIEQTQNIKNYSMKYNATVLADRIANSGIVAIGKSDSSYYVSSGNLVAGADVAGLCSKLDLIMAQDKTSLKKMYKEQLHKEIPEGSQGAGLGLIDMARKASQPLKYSIVKQDDAVYFFTLMVRV